MSHFTSLPTRLTDAEILITSLRDLGLVVQTQTEVRGENCQRLQAEIVAVLAGGFDLGWTRNPDGTFNLVGDLWGVARKHNQTRLIQAINQRYVINRTLAQAKVTGHRVVAQTVGEGTQRLTLTR
ncbi:DUF1257 domain-containing protein [Candidatus Cyanaurora vandensis]|uniref:DUF1257 domain-containing protein n=1 Tax=Candidatus Cyanaurora vandensis TaxID=2714958 RepID=UPI00257BB984|nr:DUF1257 domain-containing protein [Candidatus Cyanaurora vandensis]